MPQPIRTYAYNETFFRYIQQGAVRSAQVIVPLIVDRLKVGSVLDVGCGAGAWLAEYRKQNVATCLGIDGDYVRSTSLLIPPATFIARDISNPIDLEQRFDLVQCLEVAEHLEPSVSRTLVANLVKHSDLVLFSAAVPGQGGENHINEQPYEFWRSLFAEHGYAAHDFLRPLLRNAAGVETWYRHNVILYAASPSQPVLEKTVLQTRVPDDQPIADISSFAYRLRTRLLSALPISWLSRLAVLKHKCILLSRLATERRYN